MHFNARLISLDCLHSTGDCFLTASSFLAISNLFIFYSMVAEKKFHHVVILTCIPLIIVKLSIYLVYWPLYAFILLKITYLSLLPIFLFKLLPVLLTYKIFLYGKDMFLTLQHPCLCAFQTCLSAVMPIMKMTMMMMTSLWSDQSSFSFMWPWGQTMKILHPLQKFKIIFLFFL